MFKLNRTNKKNVPEKNETKASPSAKPKTSEQRKKTRQKTAQTALLVFDNDLKSRKNISCKIIDISSTGARLSAPPFQEMVQKVFIGSGENPVLDLFIHYGGSQYKRIKAQLRWFKIENKTFGVKFLSE